MKILTPVLFLALLAPLAASAGAPAATHARKSPILAETQESLDGARRSLREGDRDEAGALARLVLHSRGVAIRAENPARSGAALDRAIAAWNAALGEPVFRRADDEEAPLTVRLVKIVDGDDDVQGEVETDVTSERGEYIVQGTVDVRDNTDDRTITGAEMTEIVEHELGHVLGLDDDMESEGLMGAFDPEHVVPGPTASELDAVREIRAQARKILADARR